MTRAALYARFSSDLQNERSAEDQLDALRAAAQARGWTVCGEYADRGISGSALQTRPAVQSLMRDAALGLFEVVFVEALDRLSRGQADTARLFELLSFYGVRIETLSSGAVSELHVGLEGTMNRLFLVELGRKTRRGLTARVRAGFSGGGRCYGYRIVEKGVLAIEPDEAAIVARVFNLYAQGESPRAIASRLNAEGVPGPRGGEWTAATINGDRRAQDGMLHNELYVGVRVFNRRCFRKHPVTGRRSGSLNPPDQWIREAVPDLRILDQDLWNRAQARKEAISAAPRGYARRPKRLLSGLLQCGVCGGSMTLQGARYACSAHRERGTCANTRIVAADAVEARVVEGVRKHLLDPDIIASAVKAYHDEMAGAWRDLERRRAELERELAEVKRRLDRLITMAENFMISPEELKERAAPLRERREEIAAELATKPPPATIRLHPGAAEYYRSAVTVLQEALDHPDGAEVRTAFRDLLDHVVFTPEEGRGAYSLQVVGIIAALLGENRAASAVKVGAGAGFEPATFRL